MCAPLSVIIRGSFTESYMSDHFNEFCKSCLKHEGVMMALPDYIEQNITLLQNLYFVYGKDTPVDDEWMEKFHRWWYLKKAKDAHIWMRTLNPEEFQRWKAKWTFDPRHNL